MIGLLWDSLGASSDKNRFKGIFECNGALAAHSYPTGCDPRFVNMRLCLRLFNITGEIFYLAQTVLDTERFLK